MDKKKDNKSKTNEKRCEKKNANSHLLFVNDRVKELAGAHGRSSLGHIGLEVASNVHGFTL
jgi:hypothetical protein